MEEEKIACRQCGSISLQWERCTWCAGRGVLMVMGENDWDCDQEYEEGCSNCEGKCGWYTCNSCGNEW